MTLKSEPLAAAAGITYRQLDHWCRAGYLRAEDIPAHSRAGRTRTFSAIEARIAIMMGQLTRAGLTPVAAHKIARGANPRRARIVGELASGVMIVLDVPPLPAAIAAAVA